jgi:uncharacterized protein (TIGR02246 family)
MKNLGKWLLFICMFAAVGAWPACAAKSADDIQIRSVIASYEHALNQGDTGAIVQLFMEDGVVMVQKSPTAIGQDSVRRFYDELFRTMDLNLRFEIAEVVRISPNWAFVRTSSSGTVKVVSGGSTLASAGHELFILEKRGTWRIARYAASSTS